MTCWSPGASAALLPGTRTLHALPKQATAARPLPGPPASAKAQASPASHGDRTSSGSAQHRWCARPWLKPFWRASAAACLWEGATPPLLPKRGQSGSSDTSTPPPGAPSGLGKLVINIKNTTSKLRIGRVGEQADGWEGSE